MPQCKELENREPSKKIKCTFLTIKVLLQTQLQRFFNFVYLVDIFWSNNFLKYFEEC